MSHTARELTLFGIYGAPPHVTRRKPMRPARPAAPSRGASRRLVDSSSLPTEGSALRAQGEQEKETEPLNPVEPLPASPAHEKRASLKAKPPSPRSPLCQRSPSGRGDLPRRLAERPPPTVVMSLYGDGFVELAPLATPAGALTVPFSLRIRMFKAADESLDRSKIESDASRHVSPELNDEGEFVRWSCCGSTDKSVFGCPVASDEQVDKLSVEELMKLRPPKLVACKLTASQNDPTDSLRFVIFDRGYPARLTPREVGALNAGCRIWWQGYECWATAYDIPHSCWVNFVVSFDGHYLQVRIDDELVDTAVAQLSNRVSRPPCRALCALGCACPGAPWSSTSSTPGSIYIGGYTKYSKCVNEWRSHAGFIGLLAEAQIATRREGFLLVESGSSEKGELDTEIVYIVANDGCEVTNLSTPNRHAIILHRNVFWRKTFPPFFEPSIQQTVRLLGNFYHGAHHDISTRGQASFENLLLAAVQVGEVRVRIDMAKEFVPKFGSDHGCRTQAEYDLKCTDFIRQLEALSPLLAIVVNPSGSTQCIGSFEVTLELFRSASNLASITLHSMAATSCFPSLKDVKAKISDVISHEARRSPGEGVVQQAYRQFLSLADQGRESRERAFLESLINRKAVITEKRIIAVFQKVGFHFSHIELLELIKIFKTLQDDYHRHQNRMDDIPTISLLSPSATGLYRLPLVHQVSLNTITPSHRSATKSKWNFIAVYLNYDLQLLDFVQTGCADSTYGDAFYAQSRYLHGGFVDRFNIHVLDVPSHVYCILFSLRKRCSDHQPSSGSSTQQYSSEHHDPTDRDDETKRILVQLENGETLQQLAQFEVEPTGDCKWLSLAALYRSRKSKLWRFQALGGSTQARSIHTGLEEMNAILVDRHIVQVYEVILSYEKSDEAPEYADFANRFSKNIRFGRNGKIQIVARTKSNSGRRSAVTQDTLHVEAINVRQSKLAVSLLIHGVQDEISVYRHDEITASIPTVQSVCRSILRTLADHGIKESLQQNPFVAAGAKKLKRSVTIRVKTDDTNTPVPNAYVFIERSLDNQKAISNLASKIVPTLTMGSRLVSIRRRLQKKKFSEEVKIASRAFVENVVGLGMRYAMVSLRDSKLVPVVKSRAILRRCMRRRYEAIRQKIFNAMSESERSRIYSRSGPTRLQQLFRPSLNFTPSEKELVNEVVELELDAFRRELGLLKDRENEDNPHDHIDAVWHNHMNEAQTGSDQVDAEQTNGESEEKEGEERPETDSDSVLASKKPKRSYQTDTEGVATCHLAPGSYSLYVFHNEFFEWTSLAVVFPAMNASGMFGSSLSTSAPQEIVVPLETFKWTYTVQLVDFYQQHVHKSIEGVPVMITDKVTSEEIILFSRSDGSLSWDVRKGIYSIRVPTEGTSIVYSGSKNVVVDGGRYHPPRTIFIPILLGKILVELSIGSGLHLSGSGGVDKWAKVQLVPDRPGGKIKVNSADAQDTPVSLSLPIGSTSTLQVRPGKYTLVASADGFFPYSCALHVPWDAKGADGCREIVVLCPIVSDPGSYHAIFSYVNKANIFDAMVEVADPQDGNWTCWRHGGQSAGGVIFHDATIVGECEYQSFTIACLSGRSYFFRVAVGTLARSQLARLRPRIQVYDRTGLSLDMILVEDVNWQGEFYWTPCSWNTDGDIVPRCSTAK